MAETIEKIYCTDHAQDNTALISSMLANQGGRCNDVAMSLLANQNQNNWMNNPFMYLIWLAFFGGGNGFGGFCNNNAANTQANEMMNQINSLRQQIGDNQLTNISLDAIRGNQTAVSTLASNLNCDFNQLSLALSNVRSAIDSVGGQIGFSSERVINAVGMGDASITFKLQEACCGTKTAILEQGYQNQLALERQTNTLGREIEAFQAQSQLQNCQNASSITQSIANLGYQLQAHKCEIVENSTANTQRILDTLNGHWQAETALALQDAKFEVSQLKQNQYIAGLMNNNGNYNCPNCSC